MDAPLYHVSHTCHNCRQTDYFETTRREAAFELVNPSMYDKVPCTACGNTEYHVWGFSMCELERDLFIEWSQNTNLYFLSQDEDLIIAEEKYLDDILFILDNNIGLPNKRIILLSALFVLIYDSLRGDEQNKKLSEKVIAELKKRPHLIAEARNSNGYIYPYISDIVLPLINNS